MPPRGVVIAIVVFWVATTGWLVRREVEPRWRAESAPAYTIDVADEAGAPQVEWHVYRDDNRIGRGLTSIRRQPDRTFDMIQSFRFDGFETPILFARLDVKRLDTVYRVTQEGRLLGLRVAGQAAIKSGAAGAYDVVAEFEGDVVDGELRPRLKLFGEPFEAGLRPMAVADRGSILNPMHLLHRLPGLREGQRWKIPLFDPLAMFSAKDLLGGKVSGLPAMPHYLEAEVSLDATEWKGKMADCFRVDYREPGKEPIARTWVRRSDGLVLAQESRHRGQRIAIRRAP